ncbi:MAG: hypothetical protein UT03_C0004G0004 [Candidatus Moranbacteria bacterium GW2011_GWD2_38_7]|nr:MAG: hypothetical protein US82_C0019G0009 [Parcubacteria group bacterium GW2011_GWC1_38_22]KKQ81365.1 MAG: hypothetical protein UT03_C0004G0004 [Candidatus Moranbacteria bacterium GW2011_GWD2_38_7]
MNTGLKIFIGVVAFLGFLSVIFLATAKNKNEIPKVRLQKQSIPVSSQPTVVTPAVVSNNDKKTADVKDGEQDKSIYIRWQWNQCKNGSIAIGTKLLWNLQITEGIPAGGTYAKGFLDNDQSFPVRVTLKSDSQFLDKIKAMLIVGKTATLRGTCTEVASDGSVILQAF